jgi:tetratricopeptide (TPR) repeat protein
MLSHTKAVLMLAVAATLAVTPEATAQFRVGSDGRLNDANNRIGSNGYNSRAEVSRPMYNGGGNNVVTGNVTGGREFRGDVGYTDPGAFRGDTADATTDRFIRSSSGASFTGVNQNNAQNVTAFYGSSRAAPPPPGFQQQGLASGAYIPAPAAQQQGNDLRLGSVLSTPQTVLPTPGDLMLPGPVDPTRGRSTITASPLYGVRQWQSDVPGEQQFVDRFGQQQRPTGSDQFQLDNATLDQYRSELRADQQPGDANPTDPNGEPNRQQLPAGTDLSRPQGSPTDPNLANSEIPSSLLANRALGGQVGTDQATRQQLMSPAEQSGLYAQLLRQFEAQGAATTDQEAQRRFVLQRNLREQINQAKAKPPSPDETDPAAGGAEGLMPGDPGAGEQPSALDVSKLPVNSAGGSAAPAGPVKVTNLAEGTKAKGLATLLSGAEESMRAGQFGAAIDRYDAAAKVAPNNPLVTLGRAHAELGASYYGRAESDLRKAFANGPALLLGQYDLVTFLGEERLAFVIKDLKEIATAEKQQAGPTFLLAYVARNMGNDKLAADYLTETEKRLGGADETVDAMRKAWNLQATDETK